ncbi:MAG: hypothetical protein RSE64_08755 [Oscillospiraceae bacterium]
MSLLFDVTASLPITKFVQFERKEEPTQIITKSLDGTVYIQSIGEPERSLVGTAYVTRAGRDALYAAQATGNLISVSVCHGTYTGRITALKIGNRMAGDYFEADVTLALEVIV